MLANLQAMDGFDRYTGRRIMRSLVELRVAVVAALSQALRIRG
jgi:hypothetical protein